jgi:hypothetical protein
LNKKKNSSASNHDFFEKRGKYSQTIFPLAQSISKKETWVPEDVQQNHEYYLSRCDEIFGLNERPQRILNTSDTSIPVGHTSNLTDGWWPRKP